MLSFCALHWLGMKSLVVGIKVCYQTLRQDRLSQALSDDKGILPERFKEFL